MPLTKFERRRRISPALRTLATLGINSSNMILISRRANELPKHMCGPPRPKDMCSFG